MKNRERLFYEKIKCIYKFIAQEKIDEFVRLFYIKGGKTSFENRKTYLYRNWLNAKGGVIKSKMFKSEYEKYPFRYEIVLDGQMLFESVEDFLEADIETFCNKIKKYASVVIQSNDTIRKYRYLYVFNFIKKSGKIDYYEINYLKSINKTITKIAIKPPKAKEFLNIKDYTGEAQEHINRFVFTFQNENDYISVIFNTDLINSRSKYLVGVGVGIADINQKIPIAKKVVLTEERVEDLDELYYILNETEIILAKENSYKLEKWERDNLSHFRKYIEKISRINQLFQNLSKKDGFYQSFYIGLALKEFFSINRIFQKVENGHSFYIKSREKILDILIKSFLYEKYNHIYIVMPTYQEDNIFNQLSSKALLIKERLKELSLRVKIEVIFIVESCKEEFSYEFREFLLDIKDNISISFALKSDIEKEVNSIDFIFTNKRNFVVSRPLRVSNFAFHVLRHEINLLEYEAIYRKILNRSLSYDEFFENRDRLCRVSNPILEKLIGKWYLHLYGTQKFWIDEVVIGRDNSVVLTTENGEVEKGEIIYKSNQSIILLEDIKTKRLLSMIFENQDYILNRAFLIKVIGKMFKSNLDVFTIGIMSRHIIGFEKTQEILGDVDDVRLIEPEAIQNRLSRYLTEKFYY